MTDTPELIPRPHVSPSFAELDRQEAEAIANVQQRRPGILALLKSVINPLDIPETSGMDTLEAGRIRCAPRDRVGSELSERVATSALLTDPTLPFDLRLVERVRKKRMVKQFSPKTRTGRLP